MTRMRTLMLAAALVLPAAAVRAAPLEAYGKLPSIEDVAISPDGSRLAIIHTDGEKRTVQIETLADKKIERILPVGEAKLRGLMWVGPEHLEVLRSVTSQPVLPGYAFSRSEWEMGFDYDLKDGTAHALMDHVPSAFNALWSPTVRHVDGKAELFVDGVFFPQASGVTTVYRIDFAHHGATIAEQGSETTDQILLGAEGQAVARTTWNERQRRWGLDLKQAVGWHEVRTEEGRIDNPFLMGLGRDGKSVLVGERRGDHDIIRELSPDGAWSEPLPIPGAAGLIFDPVKRNLIGYSLLDGDDQRTVFFDPHDQQVWQLVEHAYPGQQLELVSWTDDRQKLVVKADSPTEGPGYALIDLAGHHADWIANEYAGIGPDDISPRKPIAFKAADGLELTGYLTIPHGREAKGLPLVVLPHGGPEARDEPGFDWLAEGIASRGYAVLQVNYRGSDGFGEPFVQAGYGQWGRKMQTDLSDGVRYLAGQGIVDPKRVCIVGASYGGYAALAGPTLDPGVYRCAVSYAGPADLHAMVDWSESHGGTQAERYWLRFMGGHDATDPKLLEISPAAHVDRVNVPILLIHGKDDTVVPLQQSYVMANDLKAAGKPETLMVLNSTDHWLTKGETRLQMLKAAMDFVEKYNPAN